MRTLPILLLCLITQFSYSQRFKELPLQTQIEEVTVFLSGAQLFETGNTVIPVGKSIIKVTHLSPYIDEKSIQVKTKGDFTILSVNHKLNFLHELKNSARQDSLNQLIEDLNLNLDKENARLEVLAEKQSLLHENKNLKGDNSGITMNQLRDAIGFYETENTKIKEEKILINKKVEKIKSSIAKIQNQVRLINDHIELPVGEVEISVDAKSPVNANFSISYVVANAGWYPKYDIRVQDVVNPIELTYKAEVFQNTGVDWNNVKLKFSNAQPNESGLVPTLQTWNLTFARNTVFQKYEQFSPANIQNVKGKVVDADGDPLPGVNILVKDTYIGTVTDLNGNYSLTLPHNASHLHVSFIGMATQVLAINKPEINITLQDDAQQLSEIVVTGYGALAGRMPGLNVKGNSSSQNSINTTVIENQTTIEIALDEPYSLQSNGEKLVVDLKKHHIEAMYEYYAIPKVDKDAFLIAKIINWDQYNLLNGEANLYFEDAYVGRSILDAKSFEDTLNISMGRDRNIIVGRQKKEQYSQKRFFGTNVTESRGFDITVRNKKSHPIKLTLFDQIPLAIISDISVKPIELSKGNLEEKTGKVNWVLQLDPQQQKNIAFEYEVRYPRREKVILE